MPRKNPQEGEAPKAWTFNVTPIKTVEDKRSAGRPKNLNPRPPKPVFEFAEPSEQALYEYFIQAIEEDYPGLKPSDRLLLPLAAVSYIMCLRVSQREITQNEQLSLSRQHPATFFARYMDQLLGTTRKNRVRAGETDKQDDLDFSKLYTG